MYHNQFSSKFKSLTTGGGSELDAGQLRYVLSPRQCVQVASGGQQTRGGEDCLNLAVFSPALRPAAPLPVIVFIHGGAFVLGSYTVYGPHQLLDRDVVLVTVHYRCPVVPQKVASKLHPPY